MRAIFLVNSVDELTESMTTARLATASKELGLDTWVSELVGLGVGLNGAHTWQARPYAELDSLGVLKAKPPTTIELAPDDQIFVRLNPARYGSAGHIDFALWALHSLEHKGYRVINSPRGLLRAANKAFLSFLPPSIVPRQALVSTRAGVLETVEALGGQAVVKPPRGTRGQNVLFVALESANAWQSQVDTLLEHGPLLVQEHLEAEVTADTRVLLLDGRPCLVDGQPLAVRRLAQAGELRSNLHLGGRAELTTLDAGLRNALDPLCPVLQDAGLRLVGVDVMNDKILELNVWAPGGLGPFETLSGLDAKKQILEALIAPPPQPALFQSPAHPTKATAR